MRGNEKVEANIAKARRGTAHSAQNAELQREIGAFLNRALGQTLRDFAIAHEKLEVLAGERGEAGRRAVRVEDMARLTELKPLESEEGTGSVSRDDFNALVRDVQRLHWVLMSISNVLHPPFIPRIGPRN